MSRLALRLGLLVIALVLNAVPASAQLNFTYDFSSNPTYFTGDRQAAIMRAGTYLSTQLDARGTVNVILSTKNSSEIGGSNVLAAGGTFFSLVNGFTNGLSFNKATSNSAGIALGQQSYITYNSDQNSWFTGEGTSVGSGQYDMQSNALHELTHGLGFTSLIKSNGAGLQDRAPGSPDTYSRLAMFLRLGSDPNSPLLINPAGTFNTAQITSADLAGNNIYFHGEMAMAANGGNPVQMAGGGSLAHVSSAIGNAVMLPARTTDSDRRTFQAAELGMLIDMGWNQFVWRNTNGNWADNISSTESGKWVSVENFNILSPVGTITPNLVLRFAGTGGYTSTNDLPLSARGDRFLVNRIVLSATAGTSTIAANNVNTLRFDTTIGVTPLIRQDGAGGFNFTHPIELTTANLQLGGDGAGLVRLNGTISSVGAGGLIKIGTSTFELGGSTANTYTGDTTVNAGVLQLNKTPGVNAIAGNVTLNAGGTLRLAAADQIQGSGTKMTFSGGTLSTGATTGFSDVIGSLEMTSSSTIALGTGLHNLQFTGITGTPTGTLTITGWSSSTNRGHVLFSDLGTDPNANSNYANLLTTTIFSGFGTGATFLDLGGGIYELAPVPEPATILGLATAALGFGNMVRRRLGKKGAPEKSESQLSV